MIPKKYYPITVYKPELPSQEIPRSPSPPQCLASTSLRKEQEERGEIPIDAPAGRAITDKGVVKPKKSGQNKRGKISLDVQIDEEKKVKGKREPERTTLQSSPASTGIEAPEQPRLSYRERLRTTVDGCRHADGTLEQAGDISL